jgi:hypothetical protein
MTTGRKPRGETAMSGAERQARYRARLAGRAVQQEQPSPAPPRRTPSRQKRWHASVAMLKAVRAEYERWLEAMPEALRDTPTGEALQVVLDLDLDEIATIKLPRGYGRD